jgi:hypothetical protein
MLISQKYRINMVLDNLPVTAQDLLDKVSTARCRFSVTAAVTAEAAAKAAC